MKETETHGRLIRLDVERVDYLGVKRSAALDEVMGRCSGIPDCCVQAHGALRKRVMKKGRVKGSCSTF